MNEALILKSRTQRKVQIRAIDTAPQLFSTPDVCKSSVHLRHLPVVPQRLVVVHLHHTGVGKFFHFHFGTGRYIPCLRIVWVILLKFPQKFCSCLCLLPWYSVPHNHIAVVNPEFPIVLRQNLKPFSIIKTRSKSHLAALCC